MKTKLVLLLGTGILSFRIVASEPQWIIAADAREATEEEKKNEQAPEGTSRFFRTVKNAKKVTKATCTATSLGVFEFYVNGRRAGEQVLMPGFTHGLKTKYSFDFDVTNLISKEAGSENVFSARVSTSRAKFSPATAQGLSCARILLLNRKLHMCGRGSMARAKTPLAP